MPTPSSSRLGRSALCALVLLATSASRASAALYENARDLPSKPFDFIVVGGGTAGNVVANRLSENPNYNVLLLEAGPSHQGVQKIAVPQFATLTYPNTPWDWNYTTTVQPGLNNRSIPYAMGHVLGGSSSLNSMIYVRASKDDYDRWAHITGDAGWSWNSLYPYFKKSEAFGPPSDNRNVTGQFDPSVHGFRGPVGVSLPGFLYSADALVSRAQEQLKDEFPAVLDYNSGKPLGFGWSQSTIQKGERSSSATGYLADQCLKRSNLHVLVHARVSKVTSSRKNDRIDTVTFTQPGLNDTVVNLKASREIVLSAGGFNTPQILMNSGIGDANELKALNIPLVKNLPSVGKNLSDHITILATWNRTANDTSDHWADPVVAAESLQEWTDKRQGQLTDGLTNQVFFIRYNASDPDVQSLYSQFGDISPGPDSAQMQMHPVNFGPFGMSSIMTTPHSRGTVKLDPKNPLGAPIIDMGYLTHPADVLQMRIALRTILRIVSAPAFVADLGAPVGGVAEVIRSGFDLSVVDDFVRGVAFTINHASCTAAMSPRGAAWGALDPDLKVKGLKGLRVVDASVFPIITSGNTQAPVYAIAERASDIIKASNH